MIRHIDRYISYIDLLCRFTAVGRLFSVLSKLGTNRFGPCRALFCARSRSSGRRASSSWRSNRLAPFSS